MAVYSIKELEKLSGIKAHTIRIWEKRYGLFDPHRTNTNIRYYTDNDLKKVLNVSLLNRHGIKISSIAKLNDLELKEEIIRVSSSFDSSDTLIDSMVLSMIDFDEYKFDAMVDKSINKIGLQSTLTDVLYPFLAKVGILWQSGDVYPAQEHFVSYLIRQKIIAATDRLPNTFNPEGKKFLLYLPEGEWHEITLLFSQYLIRATNHEVIYLGQSVPYSDVLAIAASKRFDFILISSSTSRAGFNLELYLEELSVAFPDKKILYCASYKSELPGKTSANLLRINKLEDLTRFIQLIS